MSKQFLDRREFNRRCATLSFSTIFATLSPSAPAVAVTVPDAPRRTVKLPDSTIVSALGQGSAALAQGRHPEVEEEEALRPGLSLGMTLIDTAEIYGGGRSEELISRVIAGRRDQVFLVSKVWPDHVR